MTTDPDLRKRIRERRQLAGLTQEQAALEVGVSTRSWEKWESGKVRPGNRSLNLLVDFFPDLLPKHYTLDERLDNIEASLERIEKHLGLTSAKTNN